MNDSGRIERIERALEAYIANCSAPEKLKQSMAYSLLAGGKRLRPSLCLQAAESGMKISRILFLKTRRPV